MMKGATTLNLPDISVVGKSGKISMVATDKRTSRQTLILLMLVKQTKSLLLTLEQKTLNK